MCGIVGYIGKKEAYPILINGLKRLEYRGYDSAGIAIINGETTIYKNTGRVSDLEKYITGKNTKGTVGMAHTRWATHGAPNDVNAHPHQSQNGYFTLIHNGIIENYNSLKQKLEKNGFAFKSETDTEVLVNLIEFFYLKGDLTPEIAIKLALEKVIGAYGLVISCSVAPNTLYAARKGSPLVIGLGNEEYFIASDASPIIEHTKSVIYLENNHLAILEKNQLTLKSVDNYQLEPNVQELDLDIGQIEKGGFAHFMLKEIFEQPESILDTFRGRVATDFKSIRLGGLHKVMAQLLAAKKITIIACGTSWHAGLLGEYLIEEFARIPVEVEYGSEFRYRNPIIDKDDIFLAISQSGETADTLAAIDLAQRAGATVIGICNVVGSSIPRATVAGVYTHAGPEIGVASTKAFTTQVMVLTMMALEIGRQKKVITQDYFEQVTQSIVKIPEQIKEILQQNNYFNKIAQDYYQNTDFLYLGRGYNFPVALEGALKLKEISYIHAEGYPAGEMKHGPIALIDEKMPIMVIATKDQFYEKILSNMQEAKARKGRIIAIATKGDTLMSGAAEHVIELPETSPALVPILATIPLQLVAYHIAVLRGCDVDQPRNLAKSVTVE
jgi:glucosamine--fructose-6-phosphate aminotransferase (isomerizing)